jgi:hypothetical protein
MVTKGILVYTTSNQDTPNFIRFRFDVRDRRLAAIDETSRGHEKV